MKNKAGFTLVETIITLLVTSIVVGMGLVSFQGSKTQHDEKVFFRRFDMAWNEMHRLTTYNGYKASITFSEENKCVIFFCYGPQNKSSKKIMFPPGMKPLQNKVFKIGKNGIVSPNSVYLRNRKNETYKIAAQLGWGVYELTKQ